MSDPNQPISTPGTPNEQKKKRNLTPLYILVIAALLVSNTVLWINSKHTETKLEETHTADTARIAKLNADLGDAIKEVESYKGQNAQLDDSIKKIETEFSGVKAALIKARQTGQLSEAEFQKERKILAQKVKDMQATIDDLKAKLNIQITKNDSLGKAVADKEMQNADLSGKYKAASAKVEIASALHASGIEAHGIIIKKSGKEVETSRASKADKVKITFNVDENRVTESGKKTIYLRLITPEGAPIYNESEGSGTITSATGETIRYSAKGDFDYSNAQKSLVMYVKSGSGFTKGDYKIELYERGYSIGSANFTMK